MQIESKTGILSEFRCLLTGLVPGYVRPDESVAEPMERAFSPRFSLTDPTPGLRPGLV